MHLDHFRNFLYIHHHEFLFPGFSMLPMYRGMVWHLLLCCCHDVDSQRRAPRHETGPSTRTPGCGNRKGSPHACPPTTTLSRPWSSIPACHSGMWSLGLPLPIISDQHAKLVHFVGFVRCFNCMALCANTSAHDVDLIVELKSKIRVLWN